MSFIFSDVDRGGALHFLDGGKFSILNGTNSTGDTIANEMLPRELVIQDNWASDAGGGLFFSAGADASEMPFDASACRCSVCIQ